MSCWVLGLATLSAAGLPVARAEGSPGVRLRMAEDWLTILRDGSASDRARLGAARALVDQSEDDSIREALRAELALPLAGAGGGAYLLQVLGEMPEGPARLYPLLAARLPLTAVDEVPKLLRALGVFRSRASARLLVMYTDARYPDEVVEAALDALEHLSARSDLARDAAAWQGWLTQMEDQSEAGWRAMLTASLAARVDAQVARTVDLTLQLGDALRQLHLATPQENRGELLDSMLRNRDSAVRSVGLELVSRELSAAGDIDRRVGDATLALLADEDPLVRASAARLVRQLAPDNACEAITRALVAERDPKPAGALLLGAARWPSPLLVEAAMRWLATTGPAREPACEAAWRLYRAGELDSGHQARLLSLVRDWADDAMTPAACGVLATLGESPDRERLRPLLFAKQSSLRHAVAEALLWYPEFLDDLVRAARADPDLYDVASRGLLQNAPTSAGLRQLLSLPKPSTETAMLGISRLARALSARDLLEVTKGVKDEAMRVLLLRQLTADSREISERINPEMLPALAEGAVLLADLQLDAREPDQALSTLELSPFFGPGALPAPRQFGVLRCSALAALGKIEAADEAGGPPEAWIRGLEIAVKQDFAPALGAEIKRRFGAGLGGELERKVDVLLAQAASARDPKAPQSSTSER